MEPQSGCGAQAFTIAGREGSKRRGGFRSAWGPDRISEAAKLQFGLDLDFSPSPSVLPFWKPGR